MNETIYSQEERLMAALSHGSIIVSGMGIIVAVVVWLTQKDKFPYAARQAMQATIYQIVAMAAMIIAWIGWTALFMVLLVPITSNAPAGSEPPPGFWGAHVLHVYSLCHHGAVLDLWDLGRIPHLARA